MEILGWPSTSMWGAVLVCLEACGPLGEYGDTLKTPAGLMRLFKELCMHCTLWQEAKCTAVAMGWPLLWVFQLAMDTQLEAEARVRKLKDELKLEKDIRLSYTCSSIGTS